MVCNFTLKCADTSNVGFSIAVGMGNLLVVAYGSHGVSLVRCHHLENRNGRPPSHVRGNSLICTGRAMTSVKFQLDNHMRGGFPSAKNPPALDVYLGGNGDLLIQYICHKDTESVCNTRVS